MVQNRPDRMAQQQTLSSNNKLEIRSLNLDDIYELAKELTDDSSRITKAEY